MVEIPTLEPDELVAGDTVEFRRSLGVFSASQGWSLEYALRGPASITWTSTAEGDDHKVLVTAQTTAAYTAGLYEIAGYAKKGSGASLERHRIHFGTIAIRPNLSAVSGVHDPRSHARKVLDAIEAVLEKRASKDQESYTIAGRMLSRTPVGDLVALRDRYREEVAREEQAERIRAGLGHGGKILVRFSDPGRRLGPFRGFGE